MEEENNENSRDFADFEDFMKLEIVIGKVISAEKIPEADRLLKIVFDIGNEMRQVIAGIAEFFPNPAELEGREMPLIINLKPKKFKGYESQAMILVADPGNNVVLLHPEKEVPAGTKVR